MESSPVTVRAKSPTFKIALGFFALIGFAQLMGVGVALSRKSTMGEVSVEPLEPKVVVLRDVREVETVVIPETPVGTTAEEILKRFAPEKTEAYEIPELKDGKVYGGEVKISPTTSYSQEYVVRHPKVSSLLSDAYRYYVRGDMVRSTLLLQEAVEIDPLEPAVVDMQARVAEDVGAYTKAKELYLKNFSLGVSIGRFYRRAAYKIEHGVGRKLGDETVLYIGAVHIERNDKGDGAVVNVPVRSREGESIIDQHVEIRVHLYDIVNGEKVEPAAKNASIISAWMDANVDWVETGVESVRVNYTIPSADEVNRHLYGTRRYFGQVIEIFYKGALQDIVAHPSTLHKDHAKFTYKSNDQLQPLDFLDNFNSQNPLLPELPQYDQFELPK